VILSVARPNHQLLLENDMGINHNGETTAVIDGVALGYNVCVNDTIELINQVYLDIPQQREQIAIGVMVGMIATLPSMQR
jgi:hypothetical protein